MSAFSPWSVRVPDGLADQAESPIPVPGTAVVQIAFAPVDPVPIV
jgi:hypothetical protein